MTKKVWLSLLSSVSKSSLVSKDFNSKSYQPQKLIVFNPDLKYGYYIHLVNGFQMNILRIIKTKDPSFITHLLKESLKHL